MDFDYFGLSDIGRIRARNEDFWQVNLISQVVAIADGMGGCLGGDVASQEAIVSLMELIDQRQPQLLQFQDEQYKETLKIILSEVNNLIYGHGLMEAHLQGMGTTLSFIQFRYGRAWVFHVGDSRIYCLRGKELYCLTQDHSLENQLKSRYKLCKQSDKVYSYRHILTNVLGSRPYVMPDIRDISCEKEDLFFLCSDGLTNMVPDADIRKILLQSATLEESGNTLISLANSRGGDDNATVVLVRIR
ncbi:PP2C family protein-serine/threonine phosphatase [Candidatus Chlamydia sanziniae]|uniref:Serine/threonine protein phosphatase n=1 Tax=Candidatus Chlamydia sanziniae TaxID=1806891 RepID=A0A1A9HVV5_9CHLA|nr:PP2C family serine/threonine-protein phosphatase [Candidatus Chlamydia sanziniae]ANH79129.1 putative serine/threonine protein phosphatase [Candidatus Chlamydia sanziniae]